MLLDQICYVGKGEHFTIASAIAKGGEIISRAVRIEGKDTMHFFLAVAVGSEETACETAVLYFYLCT